MTTGRTLTKYWRVYADGYDLSGFGRTIGPLDLEYDEADLTATMSDTVKGYLRNHAEVNCGTLNAVFDNTATTGLHAIMGTAGGNYRNVITAIGIQAAPAQGDPVFGGQFVQKAYQVTDDGGAVTVTIPFSGWGVAGSTLLYATPWGNLLHANSAVTAANTAAGIDNPTEGATAKGGYFMYQVLASSNASHTATISVDDSANNSDWLALSGATSGVITVTAGVSGLVALGNTATVRRYLRWQIALGTATSVTFVSAFFRNY